MKKTKQQFEREWLSRDERQNITQGKTSLIIWWHWRWYLNDKKEKCLKRPAEGNAMSSVVSDWEWCQIVAVNNGQILDSPVELTLPEGEFSLISEPLWKEVACQWGWLASGEHYVGCDPGCCSERAPQINSNHMNLLKSQALLFYCCYNWTQYILLCSHFVLSKAYYFKIQ